MKFGEVLKYLRNERNITQVQLAAILNVTDTAVRFWETKGREPSYEMLICIANFFDVTVGQLLGTEDL